MDNYTKLVVNPATTFKQMVMTAFGYDAVPGIDLVYPKQGVPKKAYVEALIAEVLQTPFNNLEAKNADALKVLTVESMFSKLKTLSTCLVALLYSPFWFGVFLQHFLSMHLGNLCIHIVIGYSRHIHKGSDPY